MILITTQQELNNICAELEHSQLIGIDTEFFHRSTYFAILSIVQISTTKHQIIIDALTDINLQPLNNILINQKITKIFHSPRQDIQIFYHLFKTIPTNVFDTQIAAHICGIGEFLSYSKLCSVLLNINIDKTHQTANWLKRPICDRMLQYAIMDVEYLHPLYDHFNAIINNAVGIKQNLKDRYKNKIDKLLLPENYTTNLDNAWKKVKFNSRSPRFNNIMQILAAYREQAAINNNIPRQHFITDTDLVKICQFLPSNKHELTVLKINSKYLALNKYQKSLFTLCQSIRETTDAKSTIKS